jgi:hypothetical protein
VKEGKMVDDDNGSFFGFSLGAMMAAVMCGIVLFATGNFVVNASSMKVESPIIASGK